MRAPLPGEVNPTYWMKFINVWYTLDDDDENAWPEFKPDTPQEILDSFDAFCNPQNRPKSPLA